jgi:hypothetical protein
VFGDTDIRRRRHFGLTVRAPTSVALVLSVVIGAGCQTGIDKSNPAAPTQPSPTPTPADHTTTVRVVSVDGGEPLVGSTVETLTGAKLTALSDGSGKAVFGATLLPRTEIKISADGFVSRYDFADAFPSFSLAPNRPQGFDLVFIRQLLYWTPGLVLAEEPTIRVTGPVAFVLPRAWQDDPEIAAVFAEAARRVTHANGRYTFTVDATPSADKLRAVVTDVPGLGTAAETRLTYDPARGIILQAEVSIKSGTAARLLNVVTHEMGHVLGLGHASGRRSLMAEVVSIPDLTADDVLAARLLVDRNPHNLYEDDGRKATRIASTYSSGASSVTVVIR